MSTPKLEIRALFTEQNIAVYAAFSDSIATVALQNQQLLPPFVYTRMTWIKPSFLWLMYRSDWGNRSGMTRILRIWITRQAWEKALQEAILTTPDYPIYPNKKVWRKKLEQTGIRVQWDPERAIDNKKLNFKSIQVGITGKYSEVYAKKWITKIEEVTPLAHSIQNLMFQKKLTAARALLPKELLYPTPASIRKVLAMEP
ncbi:MAG: DUF4291 family protein [Aureispira sp.]